MKVTIAYLPEEERWASLIKHFACHLCAPVKVHLSDAHPPFRHIYLTTKMPETSTGTREEP